MQKTIIGLLALVVGTGSALALNGPGRALVASDTLRINTAAVLTGSDGGNVQRSYIPPYSGKVRLKWEIKSSTGGTVGANAFVHAMSTCDQQVTTATSFVTQTCDIQVVAGYPVIINATAGTGNEVSLRNVQMLYSIVDSDGQPIKFEVPPQG
jgi:hypothetical protein